MGFTSRLIALLSVVVFVTGCTSLPQQGPRTASYALGDTENTRIGHALSSRKAENADLSGFYLLTNGLDAFVARAALAETADKSIDAQYYLVHNDLVGKLLGGILVRAADRGVRVRLLVDDMALFDGDTGAANLNTHPNIEVRIFNPFFRNAPRTAQLVARFGTVTRRMHNKSFTVDNQIAVLGGRNIGNEYFNADHPIIFGDLDVLAVGPVVENVSGSFDLYWNHRLAYPVDSLAPVEDKEPLLNDLRTRASRFRLQQEGSEYMMALRQSDLTHAIKNQSIRYHWGHGAVVYDDPEKILTSRRDTNRHLSQKLRAYTSNIQDELIIISPYFVPGKEGTEWLISQQENGVKVRILTNSLASTDVSVVHAGYIRYRKALLRAGIEMWEFNKALTREQRKELKAMGDSAKASLHAKSFVIDRKRVFIGSLNLDPRSLVENTEIGVVVDSDELAEQMTNWFNDQIPRLAFKLDLVTNRFGGREIIWHGLEDGVARIYTSEPHAGFWRRVGVNIMRWLPIESQL